jgi:hypothetical protein
MPIPAVTSYDAFLRALLELQVTDFDVPVAVEDVLRLVSLDQHDVSNRELVPRPVKQDIQYLERLRLLEFFPHNPHVRLTPMGVYRALLFTLRADS